jgi:hypothetical protein
MHFLVLRRINLGFAQVVQLVEQLVVEELVQVQELEQLEVQHLA